VPRPRRSARSSCRVPPVRSTSAFVTGSFPTFSATITPSAEVFLPFVTSRTTTDPEYHPPSDGRNLSTEHRFVHGELPPPMPARLPLPYDCPKAAVEASEALLARRYFHCPPSSSVYAEPSTPAYAPLLQFRRRASPASYIRH